MGSNILFKEYDPLYIPQVPGYAQALGETGAERDTENINRLITDTSSSLPA